MPTRDAARRFRGPARRWLVTLATAGALSACANGPNLSADYGQTARENFELANAEFSDRDFEEAIAYADFVRIRFPFSRFAVDAELLIARSEFSLKNYVSAQDAFKQFAKMHPTHEHVRDGWASYMAAASAYMAAPGDFFLLPAAHQRDQALLKSALVELRYFFDHHPSSPLQEDAVDLQGRIQRELLKHELYVARYYLDRDRPRAAVTRLESAHAQYPGIGMTAEVLFLLGVTYLRLDEIEQARNTFSDLQAQYPKHHHGQQASLYLQHILDEYGPADPNRAKPPDDRPIPVTPARPKRPIPGQRSKKDPTQNQSTEPKQKKPKPEKKTQPEGQSAPAPSPSEPANAEASSQPAL